MTLTPQLSLLGKYNNGRFLYHIGIGSSPLVILFGLDEPTKSERNRVSCQYCIVSLTQ